MGASQTHRQATSLLLDKPRHLTCGCAPDTVVDAVDVRVRCEGSVRWRAVPFRPSALDRGRIANCCQTSPPDALPGRNPRSRARWRQLHVAFCNFSRVRTGTTLLRLDRLLAMLDPEPKRRSAPIDVPTISRQRVALLAATLVTYLAVVWAVLTTSWLVRLDWQIMFFRPYQQWPQVHAPADYYVVLGQRGPTAVVVAAWLGWRSWRQRVLRPLLALGICLLLLNITVGAAKIGMGRLGPHAATMVGSNEMRLGGDLFPSGHTANAVVTWGILAYLAATPRAQGWLSAFSAAMALGIGLTTVYLGTHWLSDVLLGWAAGLLILLALPWFEPLIARAEAWIIEHHRLRAGGRAQAGHDASEPALTGSP